MSASVQRLALVTAVVVAAVLAWRSQLVRVGDGGSPRPLQLVESSERVPLACDAVLPVVPVGMLRLHCGGTPLLIHYWAPWERHGRAQAAALDSLARTLPAGELQVVLVCSDPFPSVARFVQRQRLRVRVLLDGPGELRRQIERPSLPHTVVIGADGRLMVRQSGEVDWLSGVTRATLEQVIEQGQGREAPSAPEERGPSPAPGERITS